MMRFLLAVVAVFVAVSTVDARPGWRGSDVVGFRGNCYFNGIPLSAHSEAKLYKGSHQIGTVSLNDVSRSIHQVQIVDCHDATSVCLGKECHKIRWLGDRTSRRTKREYNGVRMQYDRHGRIENYSRHTVQDPYADGIGGWPLGGYELLIVFGGLAIIVLIIVVIIFHNHMPCSKRPDRTYHPGGRGRESDSLRSDD